MVILQNSEYLQAMDLTICLITKGREQFLSEILNSLEAALVFDDVSILIIDNGSEANLAKKLENWCNDQRGAIYKRLAVNDSRPSVYWKLVQENAQGWITLPSDDDVFNSEIIEVWRNALRDNPKLGAWSSVSEIINEKGLKTGEFRKSNILDNSDRIKSIVDSFHRPPFHWPALFFNLDLIPREIPSSRYAFDWWVGLNLVFRGEVAATDRIGLSYRVHDLQESSLAPSRRKNYETLLVLENILESAEFHDWISTLSLLEIKKLWDLFTINFPIYGEREFGIHIIRGLYQALFSKVENTSLVATFELSIARSFGVLIGNGELLNISKNVKTEDSMKSNFSVSLNSEVCEKIVTACSSFSKEEIVPQIKLRCRHCSKSTSSEVFLDCKQFVFSDGKSAGDLVIKIITEQYENTGKLLFTLSPLEKDIVKFIRRFKNIVPYKMMFLFKNKFSGRSI